MPLRGYEGRLIPARDPGVIDIKAAHSRRNEVRIHRTLPTSHVIFQHPGCQTFSTTDSRHVVDYGSKSGADPSRKHCLNAAIFLPHSHSTQNYVRIVDHGHHRYGQVGFIPRRAAISEVRRIFLSKRHIKLKLPVLARQRPLLSCRLRRWLFGQIVAEPASTSPVPATVLRDLESFDDKMVPWQYYHTTLCN